MFLQKHNVGEEVILKWAQKNLPIEVIKRKPQNYQQNAPGISSCTFLLPSLLLFSEQTTIPVNKGSSTWQMCFPEWDLIDHCQHLHLNGPPSFCGDRLML